MPSAIPKSSPQTGITKFTNCLLVKGDRLVKDDLWISSVTGKILQSQEVFYEHQATADRILDLGGRILAPGFIDVQLNGWCGFDFSVVPNEPSAYPKGIRQVNKKLIETGVTSYLPTIPSQKKELYTKALPHLGPSGKNRDPADGAESLGAHVEGPFISPTKNGIHTLGVLQTPTSGFSSLEDCYGSAHLSPDSATQIKKITIAPELPGALSCIPQLTARNIIVSIGHSEATFETATSAISAGATMITHLFNAMRPLHHRNPGIFGILGTSASPRSSRSTSPTSTSPSTPTFLSTSLSPHPKPFFGIIADGIHLHPTSITIAYASHPTGFILVTDAMALAGLPDGTYPWTNGELITKRGAQLTLNDSETIAGTSITLIQCVENFVNWCGIGVAEGVRAVTETPAKMLGLRGTKGGLEPGCDADLVVLGEAVSEDGWKELRVEQVWKFGECVHGETE
ncbi:carbohydrate esterase family 9 protein [Patellaria atrata CBS 101060]|uniref:N-acetylglucosamine-6-phosphate deacetylase n=1 Tax=Patellaria atrata CBS 101060 TaxID=1346257 RepID=A0A9P4SI91_9PEZI|nr:carbohydrate esterase family 9 protein [Patellaria atrata CBS 101060]